MKRRLTKVFISLLCLGALWLCGVLAAITTHDSPDSGESADAIIVLGAGVDIDHASPVLAGRLEEALRLLQTGRAKHIILTGGKSPGDTLSESAAGMKYLAAQGVPKAAISIEERSHTTLDNLREAQGIMTAKGHKTALIVSDPLHLFRSHLMCGNLGISGTTIGSRFSRYQSFTSKSRFALRELLFVHVYWISGK